MNSNSNTFYLSEQQKIIDKLVPFMLSDGINNIDNNNKNTLKSYSDNKKVVSLNNNNNNNNKEIYSEKNIKKMDNVLLSGNLYSPEQTAFSERESSLLCSDSKIMKEYSPELMPQSISRKIAVNKKTHQSGKTDTTHTYDKEKDSLFECFEFLMNYNKEDIKSKDDIFCYWQKNIALNDGNKSILQKKRKFEFIEKMRQNKNKFKGKDKITKLSEIEEELSSLKSKISIKGFITICHLENIKPFSILYKNTYYDFMCFNDINSYEQESYEQEEIINSDINNFVPIILYDCNNLTWSFDTWNSKTLNDFKKNAYKISDIIKPLKAISNYKLDELLDIYNKIGLKEIIKKKQNIYDKLNEYFINIK